MEPVSAGLEPLSAVGSVWRYTDQRGPIIGRVHGSIWNIQPNNKILYELITALHSIFSKTIFCKSFVICLDSTFHGHICKTSRQVRPAITLELEKGHLSDAFNFPPGARCWAAEPARYRSAASNADVLGFELLPRPRHQPGARSTS
jgi:hypothetical protein